MTLPQFRAEDSLYRASVPFTLAAAEPSAANGRAVPAIYIGGKNYPAPPWDPCVRCHCSPTSGECACAYVCQ
jgi:hypothetical protein